MQDMIRELLIKLQEHAAEKDGGGRGLATLLEALISHQESMRRELSPLEQNVLKLQRESYNALKALLPACKDIGGS